MGEAASAALSAATRTAHRSLEALPRLERLFAEDYRQEELAELVGCMLAIYRPLERQLAPGAPARMLGYRPRVPLLEQAASLLRPPACGEIPCPELHGAAMQWGALYVIEGSALGGQLIHRRLRACFPWLSLDVLAFWHPHGDEFGERWRLFRKMADQELTDAEDQRLAADSAAAVFGIFHRALA